MISQDAYQGLIGMLFIQPLADFLARLEIGHALGRNADRIPAAGVPSGAGFALARGKGAETAQLDASVCDQARNDFIEEDVDDLFYVTRRQVGVIPRE